MFFCEEKVLDNIESSMSLVVVPNRDDEWRTSGYITIDDMMIFDNYQVIIMWLENNAHGKEWMITIW